MALREMDTFSGEDNSVKIDLLSFLKGVLRGKNLLSGE